MEKMMRYFTGKSETFDPLLVLDEKSRNDIYMIYIS